MSVNKFEGSFQRTDDLSGFFRGRVEANSDPLQLGRVKVRVPMFHGLPGDGISLEALPWAFILNRSSGYNYGSFIVPEIGEYVLVIFEDKDQYRPIVLGSLYGTNTTISKEYGPDSNGKWYGEIGKDEVPIEAQVGVPDVKMVYKNRSGSYSYYDNRYPTEKIITRDRFTQKIEFDVKNKCINIYGGVINIEANKHINPEEDADVNVQADMDINTHSDRDTNEYADRNINLMAGLDINIGALRHILIQAGESLDIVAPQTTIRGNVTTTGGIDSFNPVGGVPAYKPNNSVQEFIEPLENLPEGEEYPYPDDSDERPWDTEDEFDYDDDDD